MANTGDALVNHLANAHADSLVAAGGRTEDVADEALLDALDSFDDSAYRSDRLQQLSREIKHQQHLSSGHGSYLEIKDEKAVLEVTSTTDRCVVHFFHRDFARCEIMHRHMDTLAAKHIGTRFIKVDVEQVPFLVTRLEIRVLPCVIPFVKGIGKTRILGFEGLGGDSFRTGTLEIVLQRSGVLQGLRGDGDLVHGARRSIMGHKEKDEEYDSDE
jgi:hypothetical protein